MRLVKGDAYESSGDGEDSTPLSPLDDLERPVSNPKFSSPAKVAWGIPAYGPFFLPFVYSSHLQAAAYASRYLTVEHMGDISMIGATDRMYTHSAANAIVHQALEHPEITHIFWTEMDMVLPKDVIPRLLSLEKPIAAGVYFLRNGGGQPCLYAPTPVEIKENPYLHTPIPVYDERGPFPLHKKAGGCPGMGCVLISMEVFRAIEEPWFDLKANDYGKRNGYGQDLYFYTKVRHAGFQVWVDPSVLCDQVDSQIVGYADYRRRLAEDKRIGAGGFIAFDASTQGSAA